MLKLWKNCDIYAPAHLGKRDILIMGGKIWRIEADLSAWEAFPEIEVLDLAGRTVCPGLIDLHVHVTGGGGAQGILGFLQQHEKIFPAFFSLRHKHNVIK